MCLKHMRIWKGYHACVKLFSYSFDDLLEQSNQMSNSILCIYLIHCY